MPKMKVFFDNKRGVRVTERVFSTPLKDQKLSAIISVDVGRDPLHLGGVTAVALILFVFRFDPWLYPEEQMSLLLISAVLLIGGFCIASLTIGTAFKDKTVWYRDRWTIFNVRRAINDAQDIGYLNQVVDFETRSGA